MLAHKTYRYIFLLMIEANIEYIKVLNEINTVTLNVGYNPLGFFRKYKKGVVYPSVLVESFGTIGNMLCKKYLDEYLNVTGNNGRICQVKSIQIPQEDIDKVLHRLILKMPPQHRKINRIKYLKNLFSECI